MNLYLDINGVETFVGYRARTASQILAGASNGSVSPFSSGLVSGQDMIDWAINTNLITLYEATLNAGHVTFDTAQFTATRHARAIFSPFAAQAQVVVQHIFIANDGTQHLLDIVPMNVSPGTVIDAPLPRHFWWLVAGDTIPTNLTFLGYGSVTDIRRTYSILAQPGENIIRMFYVIHGQLYDGIDGDIDDVVETAVARVGYFLANGNNGNAASVNWLTHLTNTRPIGFPVINEYANIPEFYFLPQRRDGGLFIGGDDTDSIYVFSSGVTRLFANAALSAQGIDRRFRSAQMYLPTIISAPYTNAPIPFYEYFHVYFSIGGGQYLEFAPTHWDNWWQNQGQAAIGWQEVDYAGTAILPAPPTRAGYTFEGWFTAPTGGAQFNFATPITADTILYARWRANPPQVPPQDPPQQTVTPPQQVAPPRPRPQVEEYYEEELPPVQEVREELFHARFMIGRGNGNFVPYGSMTRAEAVALLVRTMTTQFGVDVYRVGANIDGMFSDVARGAWYFDYLAIAYRYGLIVGFPDGTFRPNQPVTRQEFAVLLARTGNIIQGGTLPYTDAANVCDWARDYVYTVLRRDLMHGDAAGTFRPQNSISRAEAAAAMCRILGRGDTTARSIEGVRDQVYIFQDASNVNAWHFYYVIEATNSHWFTMDGNEEVWTAVTQYNRR